MGDKIKVDEVGGTSWMH